MAVTYSRLFDSVNQFMLKNGAINVAGLLKVKLEGTDDWAPVFDENGTQLQQPVILDNNGRSKGLFVDASKVYWLEVDDRDGYELFTIRKMTPCGGGAGSSLGATYDVQSTDGTVNVTRYDNGGTVTFDLSIATVNEQSKWGATFGTASSISAGDIWEQVPAWTSAGSVNWNNGWEATKDCVADIAASLEMTSGDADAISTFDVRCDFSVDGNVVSTEYGMLDPSDNSGRVTFEYKGALTEGQKIDCRFSVKSVEAMNVVLAARAYYNEECDGIIGDDGASYTAGEFIEISSAKEISVTGVQPLSGMSSYVYQSAFDNCCSAMSGYVSSLQNDVSSISSTVSGLTGQYVEISSISGYSSTWNSASAVSGKLDESAFTSYTATATGFFTGVSTDSSLTGNGTPGSALGVNRMELIFDSSMTTSVSDGSATVGVNTAILSGKLDASAISSYALSADVSSCIDTVSANSASWGGGATGDYVEKSAIDVTIGDANTASGTAFAQGSANSAERYSLVQGYGNSALQCSMAQGYDNLADHWSMAQGSHSTAYSDSLAQGYYNSAYSMSFAQGGRISASGSSMAQGYHNSAFNLSFSQGRYLSAVNTAAVFGVSNLRGNGDTVTGDSAAFVIGDGWESSTGRHDLMVVTRNGEITLFSSTADTAGTGIMSSLRHISANYQPSGDYIYASSLGTGTI